jgi:hypothetical protein
MIAYGILGYMKNTSSSPKKRRSLYLPPALDADLLALAEGSQRSINGQIIYILRRHLAEVKRKAKQAAS